MSEKPQRPHGVTVYINTRPHVVETREISFEELFALAFPGQVVGPLDLLTIAYSRGHGHGGGTQGQLEAGQSVRVKEGMIFVVTYTNRS